MVSAGDSEVGVDPGVEGADDFRIDFLRGGSGSDRHPGAQGEVNVQRVVSLTQRRLMDPAAVIAGLPPDTRPVPSVSAYDELLAKRTEHPAGTASKENIS